MVPKEQVVMAVPFYTRLWAKSDTGLSSEALTMKGAEGVLKRRNIEAKWDEETAQNYAEYEEKGITYKIWLEDVDSITGRLNVIGGSDVAGVAAWRLGFETEEIWPVIGNYMK
jgi:spore germination protein YaaH